MPSRHPALPLIAAITVAAPTFAAENAFDGRYNGERVLTQGIPGACAAKDSATAIIRGNLLTFSHNAIMDYTIEDFSPRADGAFIQLSADVDGGIVDIRGHISAGVLDADITSANCEHHWHLEKLH